MKLWAVATVLLAAGCVHFEPRPLTSAENVAQLEQRSLSDPALQAFIATNLHHGLAGEPSTAWDLDMLTLAAFFFHPQLDVARAQWAVAEAGRITAGDRPGHAAALAPAHNATTATPTPRIVTATADLGLETAGKRGYRTAQAAQLAEAARLNIASVAWQVRSRVRSRLLDLYGAREREALLERQQAIHTENVRILDAQYQAGAVSGFALSQARLAADGARFALRDAERRREEARVQLADAIGVPVRALEGVELSFASFGRPAGALPAAEARRRALTSRADVLGALAEYAASQSELQLEIARQYPDIHLGPGYEYDQGDNKWSLGVSLALPANRNKGPIAEAQARRAEASARFNALQARVLTDIDLAVAGYRAALAKQADASALRDALGRQERVARSIFEIGEISRSELAALQLQLSVSELTRLDALVQAQEAAGRLEDAVQAPLAMPPTVWQDPPRFLRSARAGDRP